MQPQVQNLDRYGRTVAVVWCDGIEVNRMQAQEGMAWIYPKYNKDPKLQKIAKAEKRGLWTDPALVPPWKWRKAQKNL